MMSLTFLFQGRPWILFPLGCVLICGAWSHNVIAQISFEDYTDTAIGSFRSESWGSSIGDYNADGWPDIWVSNHRVRPSLYRNTGNGSFANAILNTSRNEFFVANRYLDQHSAAWSDLNGDGDDDMLMQGNGGGGNTPSGLLISNGSDQLTNSFSTWGLPTFGGRGIGWVDFDLDGDLDLFRSNLNPNSTPSIYVRTGPESFGGDVSVPNCGGTNSILISDLDGDESPDLACVAEGLFPRGMFRLTASGITSIAGAVSIPGVSNVVDVASADFDNDLDADLIFARGTLQKNQARQHGADRIEALLDASPSQGEAGFNFYGGGQLSVTVYAAQASFVERRGANAVSTTRPRRVSFTLDPGDPDVQGLADSRSGRALYFGYDAASDRWDVVLTATSGYRAYYITVEASTAVSNVVTTGLRNVDGAMRPEYLRNDGNGQYIKDTGYSSLPLNECVGLAAADFDNDMDVDLYFVCQRGAENIRNRLYANDGTGRFSEVANAGGAGGPEGSALFANNGWGDNASVGDFDNDGYLDLFVTNGISVYPTRNRAGRHQVFMNAGSGNNWIKFDLKGTSSAGTALGAQVEVTANGITQMREQNGGYHRFTQNHQRLHFGLATASSASVRVRWPDGTAQDFASLAANATYELVQGGNASVVTPGSVTPFPTPEIDDECGVPTFAPDIDRAVFVFKDCSTGRWRLRVASGGDLEGSVFNGSLISDHVPTAVAAANVEAGDVVTGQGSARVDFSFTVSGSDVDEFGFNLPANVTSACLVLASPGNALMLLGPDFKGLTSAWDLVTRQPCSDSSPAQLSVLDTAVDEASGQALVSIVLDKVAPADVTLTAFTRASGDATAGSDFYGVTRNLIIPAGSTTGDFTFTILDDSAREADETLSVRVANVSGAGIERAQATVTIVDDDSGSGPGLTISDTVVSESDGTASVMVSLSAPADVRVDVFTRAGSATGGGEDFYGFTRRLEFSGGVLELPVVAGIRDDSLPEATERFTLRLINPVGAVIHKRDGEIQIEDDD